MVKCRDCKFYEENWLTSLRGIGLYKFGYCQRLVHACKLVEPDIERDCAEFEENQARGQGEKENVMAMGRKKTRDFKNTQCRHCKRVDKRALRKGWPCCPLLNPQIRNGHCVDRKPTGKGEGE